MYEALASKLSFLSNITLWGLWKNPSFNVVCVSNPFVVIGFLVADVVVVIVAVVAVVVADVVAVVAVVVAVVVVADVVDCCCYLFLRLMFCLYSCMLCLF